MEYGLDRDDFDAVLAFLDLLAPKASGAPRSACPVVAVARARGDALAHCAKGGA